MCHKSSRHTQIGSLKEKPTRRHDVKIVITVGTIKFKNHARGRQGEKKCVSLFNFHLRTRRAYCSCPGRHALTRPCAYRKRSLTALSESLSLSHVSVDSPVGTGSLASTPSSRSRLTLPRLTAVPSSCRHLVLSTFSRQACHGCAGSPDGGERRPPTAATPAGQQSPPLFAASHPRGALQLCSSRKCARTTRRLMNLCRLW